MIAADFDLGKGTKVIIHLSGAETREKRWESCNKKGGFLSNTALL